MLATKFVLVGDHYQLPPLVQVTNHFSTAFLCPPFFMLTSAIFYIQSFEARESGMGISLFWRLSEANPQAISALRCQVCQFELYFFHHYMLPMPHILFFEDLLCSCKLMIRIYLSAVPNVIWYYGALEFIDLWQ
jgi:hypothetical protein